MGTLRWDFMCSSVYGSFSVIFIQMNTRSLWRSPPAHPRSVLGVPRCGHRVMIFLFSTSSGCDSHPRRQNPSDCLSRPLGIKQRQNKFNVIFCLYFITYFMSWTSSPYLFLLNFVTGEIFSFQTTGLSVSTKPLWKPAVCWGLAFDAWKRLIWSRP